MDRKEGLADIGKRIAEVLKGDPRESDEILRGRIAFFEEVERRNRPPRFFGQSARRQRRLWPFVLSACALAGTAGLWIVMRPITFQLGEARPGQLGSLIEAADGPVMPVSFSEGSTLVLHHGGRMRVLSFEADGARVLVEEGVVDATIAHRTIGKTGWEFELGPYRVRVNGTKFRMAFRAEDGSLRVSTDEGRVTVSGGCLEGPRAISAGQSLETSCQPRKSGELPAREPPPAAPPPEVRPTPPVVAPADRTGAVNRWRDLLAAGRLLEGLRAAERGNFDHICQIATTKELLALSDASRFFGPPNRAIAALETLRRRFPGSMDAGTAAFTLGRVLFERENAYAQAAAWFETYLREQPRGPLMGDAFGRLMEARLRSGDIARAHASAEQYLRRFPEGPYSSEARGILSR